MDPQHVYDILNEHFHHNAHIVINMLLVIFNIRGGYIPDVLRYSSKHIKFINMYGITYHIDFKINDIDSRDLLIFNTDRFPTLKEQEWSNIDIGHVLGYKCPFYPKLDMDRIQMTLFVFINHRKVKIYSEMCLQSDINMNYYNDMELQINKLFEQIHGIELKAKYERVIRRSIVGGNVSNVLYDTLKQLISYITSFEKV
jgi:hypothetical protein